MSLAWKDEITHVATVWRNPQLILNGFAHLAIFFFAKSIRVLLEGFSGHGVDFWVWDPVYLVML